MTRHRGSRRTRLLAATSTTLLLCWAATAPGAQAAPAAAQATWTVVPSPSPSTIASTLQDVAALTPTAASATSAWAVGYRYDDVLAAYRTLAMRFRNGAWSVVTSPNNSNGYNTLDKVDATAQDNVWALGRDQLQNLSVVLRFDGTAWRTLPRPGVSGLRDVATFSPAEGWAVGYGGAATLTMRYRGGSWQVVPSLPPAAGRHLMVFEAVDALAPDDVWAVGWDRDYNAPSRPVSSIVAHWDGTRWTRMASPSPRTRNTLYGVTALAPDDVWAVGVAQDVGAGIRQRSLVLHYDGTAWTEVPAPQAEPGSDDQLHAAAAVSRGSVWAVGYYSPPGGSGPEPLLLHWDGTALVRNPAPALGVPATLYGAAAGPGRTVWATGYRAPPFGADQTLTIRTTTG